MNLLCRNNRGYAARTPVRGCSTCRGLNVRKRGTHRFHFQEGKLRPHCNLLSLPNHKNHERKMGIGKRWQGERKEEREQWGDGRGGRRKRDVRTWQWSKISEETLASQKLGLLERLQAVSTGPERDTELRGQVGPQAQQQHLRAHCLRMVGARRAQGQLRGV